jgi:hypothetical protein
LSPFVVPITTCPWIWPYNGKIIRGSYQSFWILPLMEFFIHVYMTNYSYCYFRWLKAWSSMVFPWCFEYYGWWLILPIFFWYHELTGGLIFLLWIYFDGISILELSWVTTYSSKIFQVVYHCLPFSPFQWPFSPFEVFSFLAYLMSLFSQC